MKSVGSVLGRNGRSAFILLDVETGTRVIALYERIGGPLVRREEFPRCDYRDNTLQAYEAASAWTQGRAD